MRRQNIAARLKGMIETKQHETNALAAVWQTGGEYATYICDNHN